MANKKKIQGICPYCGKNSILTLDHVIPQCLYTEGIPSNAPKIGACSKCNNILKSRLDVYIRDVLITDIKGSEHPVSLQLFPKLVRSIGRNQSEFARGVKKAHLIPRFTPGGVFAGFGYAMQLSDDSLGDGIAMMTRGLYYFYTKRILPQSITILVHRQWNMQKLQPDIQMLFKLGAAYKSVGDDDFFECIYLITPERPTASLWFLSFLRSIYFSIAIDLLPST